MFLKLGTLDLSMGGEHALLGHDGDVVGRGEDDVVVRAARLELGEHGLVRVEGVVDDLAVVLFLELGYHRVRRIVGPIEDVQLLRLRLEACCFFEQDASAIEDPSTRATAAAAAAPRRRRFMSSSLLYGSSGNLGLPGRAMKPRRPNGRHRPSGNCGPG